MQDTVQDQMMVADFAMLLAAQTDLADALEKVQQAQSVLADATVALGERTGLLTA